MKEKIKNIVDKKIFHVIILVVIIVSLLSFLAFVVLKYDVEGETNMPFELTKVSIISSSEGIDKEAGENRWAFDIYQNNDIFLYIDKNENYKKTAAIKNIEINNFAIEAQNKENIKIYKPNEQEENLIFKYNESDIVSSINYQGSEQANLKKLKIANQGGIVAFRCLNDKITEYKSNEEEINHAQLLQKSGVTKEQLEIKLTFDFILELEDGKQFKTNISLEMPKDDIIEKATTQEEITDMSQFVFKRIKN